MAGVANEPAHLGDGARALIEGVVDAHEHGVERSGEPPDLGVRCASWEAL
ncbi:hypothetical protein ACFPRL_26425 [Pseudoclavibacter helvolus]